MTRFSFIPGACMLAATLLAGTALAAEPAHELITDPAELAARGFDPGGPPLWRLPKVHDPRPMDVQIAERLAGERSAVDVGGGGVRWATVQGTDFAFLDDSAPYSTGGNFELYAVTGSPNRFADAPIILRDDRRLLWLDVWTTDTNAAQGVDVALYRSCYPSFTSAVPVVTELAVVEGGTFSDGNRWQFVGIPGSVAVDSALCAYYVRARFSDANAGDTVIVQKVRIQWAAS